MSDFDEVLERLLTDPSFLARLAADPARALAGYVLDANEVEVLRQQVSADAGAQAALVEDRVSQSSTFGLFSSFGVGGVAGAAGGFVAAPADGSGGSLGEWSEFGSAAPGVREGLGSAPEAWGTGGGEMPARSGLGPALGFTEHSDLDGLPAVSGLGDAPRSGLGDPGSANSGQGEPEHLTAPKGYDNKVDADGDGSLDKATYRGREDGGAEIRVDLDGDGSADFVGVDKDLDNRVDFADYDKDHDGVFEKRMFDDDGDGFLDRTVWH